MHRTGINVERRKSQMTNTQLGSPTFPFLGYLLVAYSAVVTLPIKAPQLMLFMSGNTRGT
jgi:hypothetical protein